MQVIPIEAIHYDLDKRYPRNPYFSWDWEIGTPLPPVHVRQNAKGKYELLDEIQVFKYAQFVLAQYIPAVIEPRTPQQKRQDVLDMLAKPCKYYESNAAIAYYCHVEPGFVQRVRAEQYPQSMDKRTVVRNGQVYLQKVPQRHYIADCEMHDTPYLTHNLPPKSVNVILSEPPLHVNPADYSKRLATNLSANGSIYLLFEPTAVAAIAAWKQALQAKLPFGALLCWQSNEQDYFQILVMGNLPARFRRRHILRGPRSHRVSANGAKQWLAGQLLKAHTLPMNGLLDPFVTSHFALRAAVRLGVCKVIGYPAPEGGE